MKCEEFEAMGLDAERDASLCEAERAEAREHAGTCPRCAALQDSWQAARVDLRAFAAATAMAETSPRVEMRLRQEFRTQHHTVKARRGAVIAAWVLATASVLVGTVSWINWRNSRREVAAIPLKSGPSAESLAGNNGNGGSTREAVQSGATANPEQSSSANGETLMADNELGDFTLLPGVLLSDTDESAIFRVQMQRGALGALGLPVNEERASEWIQVDLLVGNDGLPQAVRLPQ
jgi:hypothetical protein